MGKPLAKGETLTDWERMPLSDEQVQYVGTDAMATMAIFQVLSIVQGVGFQPGAIITFNTAVGLPQVQDEARKKRKVSIAQGDKVHSERVALTPEWTSLDGLLLRSGDVKYARATGERLALAKNAAVLVHHPCLSTMTNLLLDGLVEVNTRCISAGENPELRLYFDDLVSPKTAEVFGPLAKCVAWLDKSDLGPGRSQYNTNLDNSGEKVEGIIRGLCKVHSERWIKGQSFETHTTKEGKEEFRKKMVADHEDLSKLPFPVWEAKAKLWMAEKWANEYEEPTLASAWQSSWASEGTTLCRTGLNKFGILPEQNNNLEGNNGVDKDKLDHIRYGLTQFLPQFSTLVRDKSADDLEFCRTMDCSNKSHNVWNAIAFTAVDEQVQLFLQKQSGVFALAVARQVSDDLTVLDIPSRRIINLLASQRVPQTVDAMMLSLHHVGKCKGLGSNCQGCEESWYDYYVHIAECECEEDMGFEFDFDLLMDYAQAFHTLTPITDVVYTRQLMERLTASGCTLNIKHIRTSPTDQSIDASKLASRGFAHCNCPCYLHYSWCLHACVHAMVVTKIITSVPAIYDPVRMAAKAPGRNANSIRGGALGYF